MKTNLIFSETGMSAEVLTYMGNDLMVVNSAKVSFGKESAELGERERKLIHYLKEHKHTAPFRHPQLQFRVKCPIVVERQMFKHQVGLTANSISGRYVDFSDEYYHIKVLRAQSTSSKQGSSDQIIDRPDLIERIDNHIAESAALYALLVEAGVSKEQARFVLPMSLMTQYIWTGSLLAFIHLWSLRLKPDAQEETRCLAGEMLDLVKALPGEPFRESLIAWGYADQSA